jgi:hypothetical protein
MRVVLVANGEPSVEDSYFVNKGTRRITAPAPWDHKASELMLDRNNRNGNSADR